MCVCWGGEEGGPDPAPSSLGDPRGRGPSPLPLQDPGVQAAPRLSAPWVPSSTIFRLPSQSFLSQARTKSRVSGGKA